MNANDFQDSQQYLAPGAPPEKAPADPEALKRQRRTVIIIGIAAVLLIAFTIWAAFFFLPADAERTAVIRDIFIIFMALESLLIGLTLVILIVQLARLINLLQNEIKPILDSTNETVNTMRGTVTFLSDNLAEPVVKLNETFAALGEVRKFFKVFRGR